MNSFFSKLKSSNRRRKKEAELQEELRFHLDEESSDLEGRGVPREEARYAARRDLGNLTAVREDTRAAWTWLWLEQLAQDLRYALRMMAANKTFSALAILSLALGIGANTAIFSFMDSILLRSLPVSDPQSLVLLSWHRPSPGMFGSDHHDDSFIDSQGGYVGGVFSYPAFELLQQNNSVFSSVFGYQSAGSRLNLTFHGGSDLAATEGVSSNYFRGLGTQPAGGRLLGPEDDHAGAPPVAVISYALSWRRFAGPANAVGQSILINNLSFTIVGVTQPQFYGADPDLPPDIYIPMHSILANAIVGQRQAQAQFTNPEFDWIDVMARLRPGITAAQAQSVAAGSFQEFARAFEPKTKSENLPALLVRPGAAGLDSLRREYSKPLYILLGIVGLILAIACANIANLLLARAAARRREIAVRLSIGAGRARVIRQLLTESVLLAAIGGALGCALALWGIRLLTLLLANGRENYTLRAELNWHVLAVVAGLCVLTGLLFGLAPALHSTRLDLMPVLKESRTGYQPHRSPFSLSRILIVAQIGVTLLIVIAAGLFARTLSNLGSIELGFNADNLLTFELNARQAGQKDPGIVDFYSNLQKQFNAMPGISSATLSGCTLIGTCTGGTQIGPAGLKPRGSNIDTIGPDFFKTMQIPILLGRDIRESDAAGSPMVAIVNQRFAKMRYGDKNPLGQHITLPAMCPKCDIEIVGVSGNSLYGDLKEEVGPVVFLPFAQGAWGPVNDMYFSLRTAGNPLSYAHTVREIVRAADGRVPIADMKPQRLWIDETINQEIIFARLCAAFAFLALAIACVGLYGTMSYNVARRTSEIGIRMALGAQRARVVGMILREVLILVAVGLAISLPAAVLMSKVVKSFLYAMKPNDPMAISASVLILVVASILAGYLPARRASKIDPISALRHE